MPKSSLGVANDQYVREFPFIRRWVEIDVPEGGFSSLKISVEKLDLDLLNCRPFRDALTNPNGFYSMRATQSFFLISRGKGFCCEVDQEKVDYSDRSLWNPWTWCGRKVEAETIQGAISFLELASESLHLTHVVRVYSLSQGGSSREITIYKLPPNFKLEAFITSEEERIQRVVKSEVES